MLRGCAFDLQPHVVTALIGPNGAGKSTLMSAVAGLHQPTEGRIEVRGEAVTASPSHPDLGYLTQGKPLYRRYRVRDMVAIARHLNARWDQAHADEIMARCLSDQGVASRDTDYLPGTLLWPLRWTFTGILVALAALFLGVGAWRLRWAVAKR